MAAAVINSTHLRCEAPALGVGFTDVRVSLNGGADYSHASVVVTAIRPAQVDTIRPTRGPAAGGTRVAVSAIVSIESSMLSELIGTAACRFGQHDVAPINATAVPAVWYSSQPAHQVTLTCVSPRYIDASPTFPGDFDSTGDRLSGPVTVQLRLGPEFSPFGGVFRYDPQMNVTRVHPPALVAFQRDPATTSMAGALLSGSPRSEITLTGFGFRPAASVSCRFRTLPSTYLLGSEPEAGVRLRGLPPQQAMENKYQEFFTSAEVRSEDEVRCEVPLGARTGGYAVAVSINGGADYTYDSLDAEVDGTAGFASTGTGVGSGESAPGPHVVFLGLPVAEDVSPRHGPLHGGTVVRIRGRDLVPRQDTGGELLCSFGSRQVAPLKHSVAPEVLPVGAPDEEAMDEVVCVVPAVSLATVAAAGGVPGVDGAAVPVGLSVDGGLTVVDTGFTFEYAADPGLVDVLPARAGISDDVVVTVRLSQKLMASPASALSDNAFSNLIARGGLGRALHPRKNASLAALVGYSNEEAELIFAYANGT